MRRNRRNRARTARLAVAFIGVVVALVLASGARSPVYASTGNAAGSHAKMKAAGKSSVAIGEFIATPVIKNALDGANIPPPAQQAFYLCNRSHPRMCAASPQYPPASEMQVVTMIRVGDNIQFSGSWLPQQVGNVTEDEVRNVPLLWITQNYNSPINLLHSAMEYDVCADLQPLTYVEVYYGPCGTWGWAFGQDGAVYALMEGKGPGPSAGQKLEAPPALTLSPTPGTQVWTMRLPVTTPLSIPAAQQMELIPSITVPIN